MVVYWVTFTDHHPGCIELPEPDKLRAQHVAEFVTGSKVALVAPLPYPACPRMFRISHPKYGPCPSFCYTPTKCAGRSSCPKQISCVD